MSSLSNLFMHTSHTTMYLLSAKSVLFPTSIIMTSLPRSVLTSSIHFEVCWNEFRSVENKRNSLVCTTRLCCNNTYALLAEVTECNSSNKKTVTDLISEVKHILLEKLIAMLVRESIKKKSLRQENKCLQRGLSKFILTAKDPQLIKYSPDSLVMS